MDSNQGVDCERPWFESGKAHPAASKLRAAGVEDGFESGSGREQHYQTATTAVTPSRSRNRRSLNNGPVDRRVLLNNLAIRDVTGLNHLL